MSLTNTQYDSIMRMYDDIRTQNRHIQNSRYDEVVKLCPEFSKIEDEIISVSMKEAVKRIASSSDPSTDDYNDNLKQLINQKHSLLASIGKPDNYLDEIYTCSLCHDTGYTVNGKCSCFHKKAIDLVYKDSNLKNITADENFSTFSYQWYDNVHADPATGLTPYNNMHKVVDVCQSFIKEFDNSYSNILFYGDTGVGKTFLSNCIAKELLDTSHSVIYLTAIELFKIFEKEDFNRKESSELPFESNYILDCDLLIIDDLGTETGTAYTNSRLFYIINERILRRKSVIISTNLNGADIDNRYSERISSRLASSYKILKLYGDDIRYLKGK